MLNSYFCHSPHAQLFLLSQRACSVPASVSARKRNSYFCLSSHAQLFFLSQRACLFPSSVSVRMLNSFSAHAQLFLLYQRARHSEHNSLLYIIPLVYHTPALCKQRVKAERNSLSHSIWHRVAGLLPDGGTRTDEIIT
jgi:hypothetical protein